MSGEPTLNAGFELRVPVPPGNDPARRSIGGGPAGGRAGVLSPGLEAFPSPSLHQSIGVWERSVRLEDLLERLGYHSQAADRRHEIHIAVPAWNDVGMEVGGQSRPGGVSLIDAHVDAVRFECPFHEIDGVVDESPERRSFLG